jgi:magnesium chelatase accessory protein
MALKRLTAPPPARHGSPDWFKIEPVWPHSEHSQFWMSDGIVWHVQRFGTGPCLLFIHGAGGASHSWRKLADQLQGDFELIIVDLPGHGFTQSTSAFRPSLRNVSKSLGTLLSGLGLEPDMIAGHSAGAAIAIKMIDLDCVAPKAFVSMNGALQPFSGVLSVIAPLAAKLAASSGAAAWLIS